MRSLIAGIALVAVASGLAQARPDQQGTKPAASKAPYAVRNVSWFHAD